MYYFGMKRLSSHLRLLKKGGILGLVILRNVCADPFGSSGSTSEGNFGDRVRSFRPSSYPLCYAFEKGRKETPAFYSPLKISPVWVYPVPSSFTAHFGPLRRTVSVLSRLSNTGFERRNPQQRLDPPRKSV